MDQNDRRVTWDWARGQDHCGAYGSTLISANLEKGMKHKALYWSDGAGSPRAICRPSSSSGPDMGGPEEMTREVERRSLRRR